MAALYQDTTGRLIVGRNITLTLTLRTDSCVRHSACVLSHGLVNKKSCMIPPCVEDVTDS
jgi:hypothetical protein